MSSRFSDRLASISGGTLVVEVIVVILGILIAFQIDGWAAHRRDLALEQQYLQRMQGDLQFEIGRFESAIGFAESRIQSARLLEAALANHSVAATRPVEILESIEKVAWRSYPQINGFVYAELQATGNLALIRSQELRLSIAEYYADIAHSGRVGLDLNLQHLFERETAGILTLDELLGIEMAAGGDETVSVSPERAIEIISALSERPAAIALLPDLAQQNLFVSKVSSGYIKAANELTAQIDKLIVVDGN